MKFFRFLCVCTTTASSLPKVAVLPAPTTALTELAPCEPSPTLCKLEIKASSSSSSCRSTFTCISSLVSSPVVCDVVLRKSTPTLVRTVRKDNQM